MCITGKPTGEAEIDSHGRFSCIESKVLNNNEE